MAVNGINSVSQPTAQQLALQAKEAMKAAPAQSAETPARRDRVDLSSRNPANKKELMATYAVQLNKADKLATGAAQVSADNKLTNANALREKFVAAREEYKNVIQGPQAYSTANRNSEVVQISQDKKLANAETFRVFVEDAQALAQNTVQGPQVTEGTTGALEGMKVEIDNEKRTVKIYAADQASGPAVVPPPPNPAEEFGI